MSSVVTNITKATMIAAVSGSDIKIMLLGNSTSAIPLNILQSVENYYNNAGPGALSALETTGTNYTQGGVSISAISAYTPGLSDPVAYYDGNNVIWNNVTVECVGMGVYRSTSGLVIEIVMFDTPLPKKAVNGPFSISWTDNHLMRMIG